MGGARQGPVAYRGHAAGSADGQVGGVIDEAPDLDQVEEDGRVDGARARRVVVGIRDGLEDLGRQLEPRSVEGRDVPPMPVGGTRPSVVARAGIAAGEGEGEHVGERTVKGRKELRSCRERGCAHWPGQQADGETARWSRTANWRGERMEGRPGRKRTYSYRLQEPAAAAAAAVAAAAEEEEGEEKSLTASWAGAAETERGH